MSEHWVELRVHGVSGTPPESILSSAFVKQVAGDNRGRFFRPADSYGREHQPYSGRVLEAYHWGRFTSGSWTQALWLLIIPFGIVNAASFTLSRPTSAAGRLGRAVSLAALRVVGLTMTCLLVFSSVEVAVDLFAWQFRDAGSGGGRQWWSVGAMVVPLAAVVLFFYFGKTNKSGQEPGEDQHNDPRATIGAPAAASKRNRRTEQLRSELADPDFFAGDPDAPALRLLHTAAPLHMMSALLVWPAATLGDDVAIVGRWVALGLFALNAVVVLFLGDPNQQGGRVRWHRLAASGARVLFFVGAALLLAAAVFTGFHSIPTAAAADDVPYRGMPGMGQTVLILLLAMVSALVLLLAATALLAATTGALPDDGDPVDDLQRKAFGRFAGGMTAFLLASVGAFLGVGFAAAFAFATENGLNQLGGEREIRVTQFLQRVAYAWGLTILEIALIAAIVTARYLQRRRAFETAARVAFTERAIPPTGIPAEWVGTVGRSMFLARLKNSVPVIFSCFAATGLLLSLAAGLEQQFALDDGPIWDTALGWLSGLSDSTFGWLAWLGTWALTLLSLALIVLGRGALRAEKARRGLNVVWDVVAFWPRRVHPFVPPPYSQHVVAALRRRISWHLGTLQDPTAEPGRPASRVVVAAHSQGSLITVAALLWMTAEEESRIGLVTFGSQLQQQFVRAFPAALDLTLLRSVWNQFGGRWRNLYRDTDPIAGPVLSWHHRAVAEPTARTARHFGDDTTEERIDPVTGRREFGPEWRLLDPIRFDAGLMAGPMFRIRGHSDYPDDPSWADAVAEVLPPLPGVPVAEVLPPLPADVAPVLPPLPGVLAPVAAVVTGAGPAPDVSGAIPAALVSGSFSGTDITDAVLPLQRAAESQLRSPEAVAAPDDRAGAAS